MKRNIIKIDERMHWMQVPALKPVTRVQFR